MSFSVPVDRKSSPLYVGLLVLFIGCKTDGCKVVSAFGSFPLTKALTVGPKG